MKLRKAVWADRPQIDEIYAAARKSMAENGNPSQWKDSRPLPEATDRDLNEQTLYVLEDEQGIQGVFSLAVEDDPTYSVITQGCWLNHEPYGVIHRIASRKRGLHLLEQAVELASKQCVNLRMDTHADNAIMLSLLPRLGFFRCGIIYTDDGTERIAFHKIFAPAPRS